MNPLQAISRAFAFPVDVLADHVGRALSRHPGASRALVVECLFPACQIAVHRGRPGDPAEGYLAGALDQLILASLALGPVVDAAPRPARKVTLTTTILPEDDVTPLRLRTMRLNGRGLRSR